MREEISKALVEAYGDLTHPSYAFAARRLEQGVHAETVQAVAREFVVDDQTSLGSDDVCITLFVRPRDGAEQWTWSVQLSLVGDYAVVSQIGYAKAPWPIIASREPHEARLLAALRDAGIELLSYGDLSEPTMFRPPNSDAAEVYTVYNALFSDMTPLPVEPSTSNVGRKEDA